MRRTLLGTTVAAVLSVFWLAGSSTDVRASGTCSANLSFPYGGAGPKSFNVCLSEEGNVVSFEAPSGGYVHVGPAEGYVLCTPEDTYWDFGSTGGNGFNPATVVQTKGPNTFPVSVTRTTWDGKWELRQTFSKDNKEQDLSITMTLKRLGSAIAGTTYLGRWADADVEGTPSGDFADRSTESVWFREARGVVLTGLDYSLTRHPAVGGSPLVFGGGPVPTCLPASLGVPGGPGNMAGIVTYNLGSFGASQSKKALFTYQRK